MDSGNRTADLPGPGSIHWDLRVSRRDSGEDFFLAGRSVGSVFFFLSLFATNMTAFAIIGSSGAAYRQGIGIFGMMATSSCLVIPLTLFFIGTRLWAVGKRFGHMTQVSYFRDRWECSQPERLFSW